MSLPKEERGGGQGCTPGYWKQDHHFDDWTDPYDPTDPFSDHFEDAFPGMNLVQVLDNGGGGLDPANGVAAETSLEDLMPQMASHPEGLAILGDGGAVIGRVTPQDVVKALAAANA